MAMFYASPYLAFDDIAAILRQEYSVLFEVSINSSINLIN